MYLRETVQRAQISATEAVTLRSPASVRTAEDGTVVGGFSRLRSLAANSLAMSIVSPFLALANETVPKILLAVVILDTPLEIGTHFFYREQDAAMGAYGGLSISATTLALFGLYLSWFFRRLAAKRTDLQPAVQFNAALLLYVAITALSVVVASDVSLSLFEVYLVVEAYLVYLYVANNVRTERDVLFVVSLLMASCLLESAIMIAMSRTVTAATAAPNLPIHLHVDPITRGDVMRVGGTVGSSNFAAAYLTMSIATAAGVLFASLARAYKWLAAAVLGVGPVALVFTLSRGGWIALTVSITLLCALVWRRRGLSLKAPLIAILALTLLYLPFHSLIAARFFGDDKGSAESRIPLMHLAFRIIEDNPVLGVGANNFTVAMGPYLTSEFRKEFLFAVHNKYLLVFSETGIGGFAAYVAFLIGTLRKGWKCWQFGNDFLSPVALGIAVGIAGHMCHMTVDVFRGRPTQQLLFLLAALISAVYRIGTASRPQAQLIEAKV